MRFQQPLHFRRCHVCGATHHRRGQHVDRCLSCGKPLPQFYYFDDSRAPIYSEIQAMPELDPSAADPQEIRMPIKSGARPAESQPPDSRPAEVCRAGQPPRLRGFTAIW